MTKRNNKITVGELQSILDRTEIQRDNAIRLLDKAMLTIKIQEKTIYLLKQKRSMYLEIKNWIKNKWNSLMIKK